MQAHAGTPEDEPVPGRTTPEDAASGLGAVEPRTFLRPGPLEPREKRRVAVAALAPVGVMFVLFLPLAIWGGASLGAVAGGAVTYGGLLSLASGFVMMDREQGRQCPACRHRNPRRAEACAGCGYDLADRPRFACTERHRVHLDPGLCACGRRLQRLPGNGGIGREVVVILKVGAWLLAFLVGMGLLFEYAAG